MKTLNLLTSACRCCQYYKPEGRRGGMCQQLGVQVQGSWKACTLALPAFASSWEGLEGMTIWSKDTTALPAPCQLVSALDKSQLERIEQTASSSSFH